MKDLKARNLLKLTYRILKVLKKIRRSKKLRQRNADENKNSITQQNDKIIPRFNQQFRDAETIMLRFYDLQRARFLNQ